MPEHRIGLRAAWDYLDLLDDPDGPEVCRRIDLPLVAPFDLPARFRLRRRFGRPPTDPRVERLTLEVRGIEALSARLNDRPIDPSSRIGDVLGFELFEPLLPRNVLVLEIELDRSSLAPGLVWGEIALVIRPLGKSG